MQNDKINFMLAFKSKKHTQFERVFTESILQKFYFSFNDVNSCQLPLDHSIKLP